MKKLIKYLTLGGLLTIGCANFPETRNDEQIIIPENDRLSKYRRLPQQKKLGFLRNAVTGEYVTLKPLNRTGTRYCGERVKGYDDGLLVVVRDDRGLENGIDEMVEITCAYIRNDALKRRERYDWASMQERNLLSEIPDANENDRHNIDEILKLVRMEKEQAYELTNENLTLFPFLVGKDGIMITYNMGRYGLPDRRIAIVFDSASNPTGVRTFLVSEDLRTTYEELDINQEGIDLFINSAGISIIIGEKQLRDKSRYSL